MTILKKRPLTLVLILSLLLSLILPSMALATSAGSTKGSLTIHKYERESGAETGENQTGPEAQVPPGSTALPGVTYEIYQTHSFDGIEWTKLATSVKKSDASTITNSIGKITLVGLDLGRYTIQEISGPDHVILNTKVFSVDIPMTYDEGKKVAYDVNIYPKNETVRGAVELTKVNEAGEALPGVTFKLYHENGTEVDDTLVFTTSNLGKISTDGLPTGKYYFQETAIVGDYALNNSKIKFTVKKDLDGSAGKTVIDWDVISKFTKVDPENPNNIIVTNYLKPDVEKGVEENATHIDRDTEFKYNITVKTPGDVEKYNRLGVTDTLDSRLEFVTNGTITGGWDLTGTAKSNITLTIVGQTLTWTVNDLSVLTPGTDIKITFTAKIKADAELGPITNVANVTFDNNSGQIGDKNTPPVVVTPTDGGIRIVKVDKNGGAVLQGAQFKLTTDKEGNNVVNGAGKTIKVNGVSHSGNLENLTTGANGEIIIDGLTPGTYYLHETKAPTYTETVNGQQVTKSYRLLTKPVKVEVANSTTNELVTVQNSKSGWDLPTTGGIGSILFTLIGLSLMGIASIAYMRRRKTA